MSNFNCIRNTQYLGNKIDKACVSLGWDGELYEELPPRKDFSQPVDRTPHKGYSQLVNLAYSQTTVHEEEQEDEFSLLSQQTSQMTLAPHIREDNYLEDSFFSRDSLTSTHNFYADSSGLKDKGQDETFYTADGRVLPNDKSFELNTTQSTAPSSFRSNTSNLSDGFDNYQETQSTQATSAQKSSSGTQKGSQQFYDTLNGKAAFCRKYPWRGEIQKDQEPKNNSLDDIEKISPRSDSKNAQQSCKSQHTLSSKFSGFDDTCINKTQGVQKSIKKVFSKPSQKCKQSQKTRK